MPHRILHVVPSLDRSGAEKQLVLLATGLPRDEFEIHVVALTRGGPLEAPLAAAGIPLALIGKRGKLDPLAFARLVRHIRSLQPRLVQTWLFAANAYGRAAARLAGVPHIVGGERCIDLWKSPGQLTIDRLLARISERIVVNSPGIAEFYASRGVPAEKFVVIPNGMADAQEPAVSRSAFLAEMGLPPDARVIGAVGRLWPQKRMKDLIWAADLLKVVRKDVHLLIIGDGPQRARLERYRDQVQIRDLVHFLGHRDDVPRLMPHFDLLWMASEYEGLPNVVLEAMLARVPVVATDISGNRDLVVPGETGCLVPVGNRAEFARAANRLLEDEALRQRMGEAGRQRALAGFSVEKMLDRYTRLYRELLNAPG